MILVTGASGLLGQHLVHALATSGQHVRAVYHRHPPSDWWKRWPTVSWVSADLLDVFAVQEVMEGISQVYHCAAVVSFSGGDRREMMHFNIEGTANVVNEALEAGVKKLVHVSSVAALGRSGTQKTINEEEQWEESNHNSAYGLSKYLAELEAWRGLGEGLDVVMLNPGIILGEPLDDPEGWNKGSSRLMKVVASGFPFYTEGVNSFVDVLDVVRAAMTMMQEDRLNGERYIISAGNIAYREVFTKMAEALKVKPPYRRASPLMTGLIWRFNWLRSKITTQTSTITRETARTAQAIVEYDNGKWLRSVGGFRYTPLEETISRMAFAFQAHHHADVKKNEE